MKPLLASKTAWVGFILALINTIDLITPILPDEVRKYAIGASGILIIVMRLMTGEPIQGTPKAKESK